MNALEARKNGGKGKGKGGKGNDKGKGGNSAGTDIGERERVGLVVATEELVELLATARSAAL